MKYKLLTNPFAEDYEDATTHFFLNRGLEPSDIERYKEAADPRVINDFLCNWKDLDNIKAGIAMLASAVYENKKTLIIVDSDCDGQTSAALFLNYCYKRWPHFTESVDWYIHSGKQHGLADCVHEALKYQFVVVPDAGTNDINEHRQLVANGTQVLVLDHHKADIDISTSPACIINNQTSDYENKSLSGVGVVWQFCRAIDSYMGGNYAEEFFDLVALGLTADMMSLKEIETRALISEGYKPENIKNPFIKTMWKKNEFKLGPRISSMGAAFYIAPFVNAMCRSGFPEEKEILFQSLLNFKAYEEIPSTKRGCKGQMEQVVEQAVRTCTNVKNRQSKAVDAGLEKIEAKIENENLLADKALIITLDVGEVKPEIRGLVANKLMAKYQRPTCVLTKVMEIVNEEKMINDCYKVTYSACTSVSYQGSARGYAAGGCEDFRAVCLNTQIPMYATGHENAFGLGVEEESLADFKDSLNFLLQNTTTEPTYYVDYIFEDELVDQNVVLDIASLEPYYGQDMAESLVAIDCLNVHPEMVTIYRKTNNTLKISLSSGVSVMMFNAPEALCTQLTTGNTSGVVMNIVGRCNRNEWMGMETGQIFIEDYEIVSSAKWGFW